MNNKIIFFSLIIIPVLSHSMDELILKNKDMISNITQWLYIENHFKINNSGIREYNRHDEGVVRFFGRDIQALMCTNKFFDRYYSNENRAQKIVKAISTNNKYLQDTCVTRCLNSKGGVFHAIEEKVNNLFIIAAQPDKQFTEDDLKDSWYVNATIMRDIDWLKRIAPKPIKERTCGKFRQMVVTMKSYTLLSMAYERVQLGKIQMLITQGTDVKNSINNSLLIDIAEKRSMPKQKHKNNNVTYFTIAQLLLENGADPDFRYSSEWPTPLIIAVHNNDQEYAYLFLKYNADPYVTTFASTCQLEYPFFYDKDSILKNAFELEKGEPKGWFKAMVDEINNHK